MFLIKSDWKILDKFFYSLGSTSREGQISLCDKSLDLIEKQEEEAENTYLKYSKLYTSSGILVGLFFGYYSHLKNKNADSERIWKMDIDILFQIAAVGLIVAVLCQILNKAERSEQALLVGIAGLVVVLLFLVGEIRGLFDALRSMFGY